MWSWVRAPRWVLLRSCASVCPCLPLLFLDDCLTSCSLKYVLTQLQERLILRALSCCVPPAVIDIAGLATAWHSSLAARQRQEGEKKSGVSAGCVRAYAVGSHRSPEARLAQPVERKALNLVVVGSSPTVGVAEAWRKENALLHTCHDVVHTSKVQLKLDIQCKSKAL